MRRREEKGDILPNKSKCLSSSFLCFLCALYAYSSYTLCRFTKLERPLLVLLLNCNLACPAESQSAKQCCTTLCSRSLHETAQDPPTLDCAPALLAATSMATDSCTTDLPERQRHHYCFSAV